MRPGLSRLLNRELAVYRAQTTDDGHGGQTTVMQMQGTVRAKVDQPSPTERMVAASTSSRHSHNVYLSSRTFVRRGDELRGADALGTVQRFRVLSVVQPSAPVYSKALAELIQTEGGT
ncbi:head-tail adaptor protein [Streptomyces sp. NPDC088812]|uniref:phage head completion protein n=1 Tax=Streptomyces sp. NPDC088812 TaxID=3365905 RepID=UPI00380BCEFF